MTTAAENRAAQRRSTYKGGEIVFNAGRTKVGCIVRDISSKGAKLEVRNSATVPDTFDLMLPNTLRQPCRVAWRKGREIGVTFA